MYIHVHHFKSDSIDNLDNMHISGTEPSSAIKENFDNLKTLEKSLVLYYFYVCPFLHVAIDKGVGEGVQQGPGHVPPLSKVGSGAQVGLCAPPPPPHFWADQMF